MKLPSGLELGIHNFLVLDPEEIGRDWFSCPEGHFWFKTHDDPPPGGHTDDHGMVRYAHAEVPKTIGELSPYIAILERRHEGSFFWKGDVLSCFPPNVEFLDYDPSSFYCDVSVQYGPPYIRLTSEDVPVWCSWLQTPEQVEWMNDLLRQCEDQAKAVQLVTHEADTKWAHWLDEELIDSQT